MDNMLNGELLDEFKQRIVDRYTAAELVDLLDISVEDIVEIQEIIERILDSKLLAEELGVQE